MDGTEVVGLLAKTIAQIVVRTASFRQQCNAASRADSPTSPTSPKSPKSQSIRRSKNSKSALTIQTLLSDDVLNRIIDCLIRYKPGSYPVWIDGRHLELTGLGSTIASGLIGAEYFSRGLILKTVRDALQSHRIKGKLEAAVNDEMLVFLCGPAMDVDDKTMPADKRSAVIDTKREKLLATILEPFLSDHEAEILRLVAISADTRIKAGGRRSTRRKFRKQNKRHTKQSRKTHAR